jgi:hypothetical protein
MTWTSPRSISHLYFLVVFITIIVGCGNPTKLITTQTPAGTCGNGICAGGENSTSCQVDCPIVSFSGQVHISYLNSSGVGEIAIMIGTPKETRFPEGAGVVVVVSPLFEPAGGFQTNPDLTSLGLIQISYLWPGQTDTSTKVKSGGEFDYGGVKSIQVLQDVIRFASGQIPDKDGNYLSTLITTPVLTTEVGLYAFLDSGIAAINVLSLDGENLPNVKYFIGRENPTVDTLTCLEAGYINDAGQPIVNPLYSYPTSYHTQSIILNYANIRWDPSYKDPKTNLPGRPYLDMDGSGSPSSGDFFFSSRVPVMLGKRYYSIALTQALLDNGSLTALTWPLDLATPAEAARDWPSRETPGQFSSLRTKIPDLKVMLIFAQADSFQAAPDKPDIHQAFQGLRFEAGLWVRLNPDRAYVQAKLTSSAVNFPDNPANTEPDDWSRIGTYAYPDQGNSSQLVPLAGIAEMADRTHFDRWDENLGQVLYIYFPKTPLP